MVMLDIFLENFSSEEIVVATFNHGTRLSAKDDIDFVEKKVLERGKKIKVYKGEAKLGEGVSEEKARTARYDFLRKVAFLEKGEIFTAHHLDDLVETVAINLLRGTGFRGLACLSSPGIRRPFLDGFFEGVWGKNDILRYAAKNNVVFREDPTNSSEDYLRNKIRLKIRGLKKDDKLEIFGLWERQVEIVSEIDSILEAILPEDLYFSRDDFKEFDEKISLEILRAGLLRRGISTTRPQRREFLKAVLEYKSGKKFNLPGDKLVKIERDRFKLCF